MIVVSDTSPLNYLIQIDACDLLPMLFGRVVVPPSIVNELRHSGAPERVQDWAASPPAWLEIRAPAATRREPDLGRGEADAIALAIELVADQLLVDDLLARQVAIQRGLSITGTLAILVEAHDRGILDLTKAVTRSRATNFRATETIWQAVLHHASPKS